MAKPKTKGVRRGGRNHQFFEGLSGFKRGLDAAIAKTAKQAESPDAALARTQEAEQSKREAADAKRKRKAYARLRAAGLIPKENQP